MRKVKILECGPRDGWQNLKRVLPTEEKLKYIDGLFACGLESVEITSFVSPKSIPQMVDAGEVAHYCVEKYPDKELVALVPNFKGAELARAAGLKNLTYVISVSESHNKANINRTHDQSFEELRRIRESLPELELCIGMATTFGCPFEGIPTLDKVLHFVERIRSSGVDTVYLADTIGIADPTQVRRTVQGIRGNFPDMKLQVHIHDTRGMGLVNTLAAIEAGVDTVQSTLGGLGGCPFAPGASGNTATEDLVYMLQRMGYDTGIDFDKLLALSKEQHGEIDGVYSGHQMNITAKIPCC